MNEILLCDAHMQGHIKIKSFVEQISKICITVRKHVSTNYLMKDKIYTFAYVLHLYIFLCKWSVAFIVPALWNIWVCIEHLGSNYEYKQTKITLKRFTTQYIPWVKPG